MSLCSFFYSALFENEINLKEKEFMNSFMEEKKNKN